MTDFDSVFEVSRRTKQEQNQVYLGYALQGGGRHRQSVSERGSNAGIVTERTYTLSQKESERWQDVISTLRIYLRWSFLELPFTNNSTNVLSSCSTDGSNPVFLSLPKQDETRLPVFCFYKVQETIAIGFCLWCYYYYLDKSSTQ